MAQAKTLNPEDLEKVLSFINTNDTWNETAP
jgi:hypothetical protein